MKRLEKPGRFRLHIPLASRNAFDHVSRSMNRKPDWVAWVLQGLVGFAGGGILGFAMIVKGGGRRGDLIVDDQKSLFLFGIALVGFGVASLLGDRLWLQNSYRHVAPDNPAHSAVTKFISIAVALIGLALVLVAIIRR
jgi:hypothetical protein